MIIENLIVGDGALGLIVLDTILKAKPRSKTVLLSPPRQLPPSQTMCSQGVLHAGYRYRLQGEDATAFKPSQGVDDWAGLLDGFASGSSFAVHNGIRVTMQVACPTSRDMAAVAEAIQEMSQYQMPRQAFMRNDCQCVSLPETVLDTRCWLQYMRWRFYGNILPYALQITSDGLQLAGRPIRVSRIFLAAGAHNERLATLLPHASSAGTLQQIRPCTMVTIRDICLPKWNGYIMRDQTLSAVVTSRCDALGMDTWQIGGPVCGNKPARDEIVSVLDSVFDLPFADMEIDFTTVDRAEGFNDGKRPDGPVATKIADGVVAGWPTKLVWAPRCAREMIELLA